MIAFEFTIEGVSPQTPNRQRLNAWKIALRAAFFMHISNRNR